MSMRHRRQDWKPLRNKFISCAALGLYFFAIVVLPVLHGHDCDHHHEAGSCGHSAPQTAFVANDECPVCEFVHLTVPFFAIPIPLVQQADTVSETVSLYAAPSIADAVALPQSRAPPLI